MCLPRPPDEWHILAMSKTAQQNSIISIQGDGTSDSYQTAQGPTPISLVDSPGIRTTVTLAVGFNAIPLPKSLAGTTTRKATLVFPSGSSNVKTLKGITGDTGFVIDPALETSLAFPVGTTTFGMTSAGIETFEMYCI